MTHAHVALTRADIVRLAARIDRPVVLVGLMGVGKSTVGRRLANLLGREFIDVDEEIERAADRSITEIFDEFGEDYFRDGERRVIARLMAGDYGVIATGGGAFVNAETRALIRDQGIAVWLDCAIDTLVERTARRDSRPLLRGGDPRATLLRMQEARSDAYAQAHLRIRTDDTAHHETALRVLGAIEGWL